QKGALTQSYGGPGVPPHAIASSGGLAYSYDPNGNVIAIGGNTTIAWNPNNMPARVTTGSIVADKSYIDGMLWKKVEQGVTTYYLPELRIENGVARKYYGAYAERVEQPGARQLRFYQPDHLGSSSVVTDQGGSVIRRASYFPWGGDRAVDGTFTPKLQFNNKEKDASGFYDYGARLYNPFTGRWLSPDPTASDGPNRYAYVRNNPLTRVDPTGYKSGWYENRALGEYQFLEKDPGKGWKYLGVNVTVVAHNYYRRDSRNRLVWASGGGRYFLGADGKAQLVEHAKSLMEPKKVTYAGVNVTQFRRRLDTPESRLVQNIVIATAAIELNAAGHLLIAGETAIPAISSANAGRNWGFIAIDEANPEVFGNIPTLTGSQTNIEAFLAEHPGDYNYMINQPNWSVRMQFQFMHDVHMSGSPIINVGGNFWTGVETEYFQWYGCTYLPPP
ncbi:MAG TPA: RHS repeat-associated core domain-containing protein, partial [Thermoanaerobaculia bacterium]|nr:RHS repeat-associated core domain-containing protein [Thermoanaerobaculia bacterium]